MRSTAVVTFVSTHLNLLMCAYEYVLQMYHLNVIQVFMFEFIKAEDSAQFCHHLDKKELFLFSNMQQMS